MTLLSGLRSQILSLAFVPWILIIRTLPKCQTASLNLKWVSFYLEELGGVYSGLVRHPDEIKSF